MANDSKHNQIGIHIQIDRIAMVLTPILYENE